MDEKFTVTVTVAITNDTTGQPVPFATTNQVWHNVPRLGVHFIEDHLIKALDGLNQAGQLIAAGAAPGNDKRKDK